MDLKKILLVPFDGIEKEVLEKIRPHLEKIFGKKVIIGEIFSLPLSAYNPSRKQFYSTALLNKLFLRKGKEYERILGIADVDLYIPQLNFVFGEADPVSGVSIISLTRLRQEFYGRSKDNALFIDRAIKEAVHELGHTYGLDHCPDVKCVMHFSNSLRDTDIKEKEFCNKCIRRIKIE